MCVPIHRRKANINYLSPSKRIDCSAKVGKHNDIIIMIYLQLCKAIDV